jgi:hypothetical protein
MKEFFYYLDAWSYCFQNDININHIKRLDWKTWGVYIEELVND